MSSSVKFGVGQVYVPMNTKIWTPLFNGGREDKPSWGYPHKQIPLELVDGWNIHRGSVALLPLARFAALRNLTVEALIKEANQQLKELREYLSAAPIDVFGELKTVDFKVDTYIENGKGEKIVKENHFTISPSDILAQLPENYDGLEYFPVSGQRRSWAMPWVNAVRLSMGKPTIEYVGHVVDFESLSALREAQINDNNENAKQEYSDIGRLANAQWFLQTNPMMTIDDLGRKLGLADVIDPVTKKPVAGGSRYGMRQKFHHWGMICKRYPSLNIVARCSIKPVMTEGEKPRIIYVKDGYIDITKLNKEVGQCLLGGSKEVNNVVKAYLDKAGLVYAKGIIFKPQDIEGVIGELMAEVPVKSNCLDKKAFEGLKADPTIVDVSVPLGKVFDAILKGESTFFGTKNLESFDTASQLETVRKQLADTQASLTEANRVVESLKADCEGMTRELTDLRTKTTKVRK